MPKVKRSLTALAVMAMGAVGLTVATGSPALAATTCQHGGGYSWDSTSWSGLGVHHVEIDVYDSATSCDGNYILAGVIETQGNGKYNPAIQDNKCDNVGGTLYFHMANGTYYAISSTGCHTWHNGTEEPFSKVGSPKNFWVNINGRQNTSAYALPAGP